MVNEAYGILIIKSTRAEYDKLILGDENMDDFDFYDTSKKRSAEEKEKSKEYDTSRSYEDIFKKYNEHKKKHFFREKVRTHGWEELNYRGMVNGLENKNKQHPEYKTYNKGYENEHYDSIKNSEYYSKPLSTRVKENLKPTIKQMFSDMFRTNHKCDPEDDDNP
eukprot:CAMPEP_0205812274 /NCGR_PEP_ID=MMETSP0205-20121125/16686_1 /ASSEMBLY_ACC=CAM_ASM_000278 /TAXON_ID=36767 /ORGANISM="Euplotes focardii, Strain TN1" /LENGTH=163 /DNA_ID=CAMNT_0053092705 /DNA_START=182 /DNA_END=670 /DNA_ORIENTATION=+